MRTTESMLALCVLLTACTALPSNLAWASEAKVAKDDFDGATRVWINPHGLDCAGQMVCPSLGARWTSARPDEAVLVVEVVNAYVSIQGVQLNIDGAILDLRPLDSRESTRFNNTGVAAGVPTVRLSDKDYLVPLDLVPKLLGADSVKVRVQTADGFIDATFSGGKKSTKGRAALDRFWAKVPRNPPAAR